MIFKKIILLYASRNFSAESEEELGAWTLKVIKSGARSAVRKFTDLFKSCSFEIKEVIIEQEMEEKNKPESEKEINGRRY